eukprot:m.988955 g.988955  ORF g.988955 m.988955 type:complete len:685 (-) comp23994_c0_seq4:5375-7429(-)
MGPFTLRSKGFLLVLTLGTTSICSVQPNARSTIDQATWIEHEANGLVSTCAGVSCCGALFQTAATPKLIVDQLTIAANDLNFTSSAERMMDDPFVSMEVPTPRSGSGKQVSQVSELMYIANFNSSSSSIQQPFEEDEIDSLESILCFYVDISILPLIGGGSEVRIFVLSAHEDAYDDKDNNYDLVHRLWKSVDAVPSYLIKPLSPVIGCIEPRSQPTLSLNTPVVQHSNRIQTGAQPQPMSTQPTNASDSHDDFGSCGNACCSTNSSILRLTAETLVEHVSAIVNQTKGFMFIQARNVSGFIPVSATSHIAQAMYTEQVPHGQIPSSLLVNMEVAALSSTGNLTASALRMFSVCVLGADETRACFADDGLNYAVQHNVIAALAQVTGGAAVNTTINFGCNPVVGSAAARAGTLSGGSVAAHVAGVVCAVVLLVATTTWIKHASLRHPQTAAAPTRLLAIVIVSMLVTLVDRHASGWAPHELPDGTHVYALNYHPVLMTVGVVVLLTEGVLAAPTAKTDPTDSRAKLMHGLVQFLALVVMAAGLACVVSDRAVRRQDTGAMHLTSAHAWLGVVVACLLVGQLLAAVYVYTYANFRVRHGFAPYHRLFGLITYFTALAAVMTGLSQFGHYIAIQRDGACLDAAFPSTSCYDPAFSILIFLVWGVAATAFASKLSETTRRSATYTDI